MYKAMIRRKAAEDLQNRTALSVATLTAAQYANTNLDSKENKEVRSKILTEIQEAANKQLKQGLAKIYGLEVRDEDEIDMQDPWWQATYASGAVPVSEIVNRPAE